MTKALSNIRPALLRRMNEQRILAAVEAHGSLSRADVMRQTGISAPTVSKTVASLIEANLLEEGDFRQDGPGRPGKTLRMARRNVQILGIEIGVRHCEIAIAGLDGRIDDSRRRRFGTPGEYSALLARIATEAERMSSHAGIPVIGLGISIPGLFNRREQRTLVSPNLHFLDDRQLSADLADCFGFEVIAIQESHALCLAERTYGMARDMDDFAMIDVSGGLGLGVVQNGGPLEGCRGLAGEYGHVTVNGGSGAKTCGCGNLGCLETEATDGALALSVSKRIGEVVTIEEIVSKVRAGSLSIDEELDNAIGYLGIGVAGVINIFNPRAIFLHGRLLDIRDDVFDRVVEQTTRRSLRPLRSDCTLIRARGNKLQGALAAISRHLAHTRTK